MVLNDNAIKDGRKRIRTNYTQKTLEILSEIFKNDRYPNTPKKEELAKQCNIKFNQVSTWFANRRAKERKLHASPAPPNQAPVSTGFVSFKDYMPIQPKPLSSSAMETPVLIFDPFDPRPIFQQQISALPRVLPSFSRTLYPIQMNSQNFALTKTPNSLTSPQQVNLLPPPASLNSSLFFSSQGAHFSSVQSTPSKTSLKDNSSSSYMQSTERKLFHKDDSENSALTKTPSFPTSLQQVNLVPPPARLNSSSFFSSQKAHFSSEQLTQSKTSLKDNSSSSYMQSTESKLFHKDDSQNLALTKTLNSLTSPQQVNLVPSPASLNSSSFFSSQEAHFSSVQSTPSKTSLEDNLSSSYMPLTKRKLFNKNDSQNLALTKTPRFLTSSQQVNLGPSPARLNSSSFFSSQEAHFSSVQTTPSKTSLEDNLSSSYMPSTKKKLFHKDDSQNLALTKTPSSLTSPQQVNLVPSPASLNSSSFFSSEEAHFSSVQSTPSKTSLEDNLSSSYMPSTKKKLFHEDDSDSSTGGRHKTYLSVRQIPMWTRTSYALVPKYKAQAAV